MNILIFIIIIIILIIIIKIKTFDIDDYINNKYHEENFKKSDNKKPLRIGNQKVYYIKIPNNLIIYKNVDNKTILFFDDYHTYINETIICENNHYSLTEFLRLFYKLKKKINLFIEVIKPSSHYEKYNDIIIENTPGFNSNNTITTIIDENYFKSCFFKGKKCNNFIIKSTDIRVSNDMLIHPMNIYFKNNLSRQEKLDIILLTLHTSENVYYILFHYLKNKNKNPMKKKKYICKNLKNEIHNHYKNLSKTYQKYILDFIENIYLDNMNYFLESYIYMFMDLLTLMKMLLVPKNQIIILYQGLHHNYYIRKFIDMYLTYDYKKIAEEKFEHKNKCIHVGEMDEIIN